MHSASIVQRIYLKRKASLLAVAGLVLFVGTALAVSRAPSGAGSQGPPPAAIGDQVDHPVPKAIEDAVLTDQHGVHVALSGFQGRGVFLVPFLTSCQEECPITTGALIAIEHSVRSDGLARKVAIVEVTVDPGRDTPERMAAYARLTGISWPLLTAAPATIAALWHFFGIYYQDVPEATPPGIDWQTQTPYTYDVDHSDGFILLDSRLHERFVAAGMVRGAPLSPTLRHLLDAQGRSDLAHPGGGSWTIPQARDAIGWLIGQTMS